MNENKLSTTHHLQAAWPLVLCLIGLDYFSTLGYQPSIAFQSAGLLAPLVTVGIVLITLLCALPVYCYVASRSPHGQGSIGLLEKLIPGWKGKIIILILLGFAACNFIFSRTFSAADAAVHLIKNPSPHWQQALDHIWAAGDSRALSDHPLWQIMWDYWDRQMVATLVLLLISFAFWAVFWQGFTKRVLWLAAGVVSVFLILNAVVIVSALVYLVNHPRILNGWWAEIGVPSFAGSGIWILVGICLLMLPKMALGLSGFELSMVAMPLIRGSANDTRECPKGRIRNTRKMLFAAAVIMALFLTSSTLVTTTLIPATALAPGGAAADRALSYLAHGGAADAFGLARINPNFGEWFGTLYDASTVIILLLAGSAVTIGLRDLVPPYLHHLGMDLPWASALGVILYIFNFIKLVVTLVFHASLDAQRGAYATSVLMLFASAAIAAAIAARRAGRPPHQSIGRYAHFVASAVIFLGMAAAVMIGRPEGILVAFALIAVVVIVSLISRAIRTTELRFEGFEFAEERSKFLWQSLVYLEFPILVPHRPGRRSVAEKEAEIRMRHRLAIDVPVVFVEASLGDPSEFYQLPLIEVYKEEERFVLRITRCTSIAHAIAAVALELSKVGAPPEIHFGWSNENPIAANLNFILFGQGNVPWMVRRLIRRAESRIDRRPAVIIG